MERWNLVYMCVHNAARGTEMGNWPGCLPPGLRDLGEIPKEGMASELKPHSLFIFCSCGKHIYHIDQEKLIGSGLNPELGIMQSLEIYESSSPIIESDRRSALDRVLGSKRLLGPGMVIKKLVLG